MVSVFATEDDFTISDDVFCNYALHTILGANKDFTYTTLNT
jgi:hypothetical protein